MVVHSDADKVDLFAPATAAVVGNAGSRQNIRLVASGEPGRTARIMDEGNVRAPRPPTARESHSLSVHVNEDFLVRVPGV